MFLVTDTRMASSQFLLRLVHIHLHYWNVWFPLPTPGLGWCCFISSFPVMLEGALAASWLAPHYTHTET